MSGERGLISYFEKKQILNNLQQDELILINKINNLDLKNSLLSDNLDLDYIEILIRERFLFGKKNETIYIIKKNDTKIVEDAINESLDEAASAGIKGNAITPFLLTKVSDASGGLTLEANVDLILNNVHVAGEIAIQMAETS